VKEPSAKYLARPRYKRTELGLIPEDWEIKSVNQIGTPVRGGSPRPAGDPRYFDGSYIPWLTVAALTNIPASQLVVTTTASYLTEEGSQHSRTLLPGTLIIANSGATLGVAKILGIKCCANDGIAALLHLSRNADPQYLAHFINTRTDYLRDVVATGNGQPNLNTELIGNLKLPMPPTKAEQQAIAEALTDADSLIESLEQLLTKKRQIKQGAMQELLTGKKRLPGFSGEWEVRRLGDVADTDPENLRSDTRPSFTFNYIALEDVDVGTLNSYSEQVFRTAPSRARRLLRRHDVLVSTVRPNLMSHLLFAGDGDNWVCSTGFCVVRFREGVSHPRYVYFHMFAACVARQIEALLTGSNYPAINGGDVRALRIPFPDYDEQAAIAAILSDMDGEIATLATKLAKAQLIKQGMMQELLTGRIRLV